MKDLFKVLFGIMVIVGYINIPIPEPYIEELPEYGEIEFVVSRGTQYHPVVEECDSDPFWTSDMTKVDLDALKNGSQKLCAVSYDIIDQYGLRFGDLLDIWDQSGNYLGRWRFSDHMNRKIKGTIDMMIHPDEKADLFSQILVRKIEEGI